ncbi:MAG: hypothetical protein QOI42_2234 [Frankiaceae bacterium]|nr:hypothetical protein [Frankiaceae bacterium]
MTDPVDELFGLPPEDFVAARDALAKSVPAADRPAVKALRRPTVAGWLVNQLVRTHGDLVEQLLDIGATLRAAQHAGRGSELRALSVDRRAATDRLLAAARDIAAASGRVLTSELQSGVAASLDAAVADAGSAAQLRRGRLTDALSYAGFGALGLASVPDVDSSARPPAPAPTAVAPATVGTPARPHTAAKAPTEPSGSIAREPAVEQAATERAHRRRVEAEAVLSSAAAERRAAEERLRLAEHALSDARMNLDLARRAERAAQSTVDRLRRHPS